MAIDPKKISKYLGKHWLSHEEFEKISLMKKFFNYKPEKAWKSKVIMLCISMALELAEAPNGIEALKVKEKYRNCCEKKWLDFHNN